MSRMTVPKWEAIKKSLEQIKELELNARLELLARSGHTKKGSKTVAMDGYKLSFTNTENVKVLFEPSLAGAREKLGEEKFAGVFKVSYTVSATGLKTLTGDDLEAALEAITTSPGTPQVKIIKAPEVETD